MENESFTEVSSQSWFSRIGDAIKGILFGLVLFAVSFIVLFWNEGRAVKTAKSLKEGASSVVSVDPGKLDSRNEGKLVHFTGLATTAETLSDPQFGISINAIRLQRQVQMYQWQQKEETRKQKKLGGSEETIKTYSYSQGWSGEAIDSSKFKTTEGHANPSKPLNDLAPVAQTVTVGEFRLSPALVGQIKGTEPMPPLADKPAGLGPEFQKTASGYYRGSDPGKPQIGDLRIDFTIVRPQTVSIVAQQAGNGLRGYVTKAGRTLEMLACGPHSSAEMFTVAQKENSTMTWILRLVGFLVMWAGLALILNPLKVIADVVPFIGDIIGMGIGLLTVLIALPLSLLTIAIAWIFYRPLLGIALLALAGVAVFMLVKRMKKNSSPQTAGAPKVTQL
jgi:hypothetical protein